MTTEPPPPPPAGYTDQQLAKMSDEGLLHMVDGLEREMQRLAFSSELHSIRDTEVWPHATWKACSIIKEAISHELKRRENQDAKTV